MSSSTLGYVPLVRELGTIVNNKIMVVLIRIISISIPCGGSLLGRRKYVGNIDINGEKMKVCESDDCWR